MSSSYKKVITIALTVILLFALSPFWVIAATDSVDINLSVDTAGAPGDDDDDDDDGGDSGTSGSRILEIDNLSILPGETNAIVSWQTNSPSKSVLSWGLTSDYELGQIGELGFNESHTKVISELLPGTTYYIEIRAINRLGQKDHTQTSFRTLSLRDVTPPPNPSDLRALVGDDAVDLFWDNPDNPDFDYVRLIRSETIPEGPFSGKVIYEGYGENVSDVEAKDLGGRFWYAIFARDKNGNFSSGAIILVDTTGEGVPIEPEFPEAPAEERAYLETLSLLDFRFIQEGKRLIPVGSTIVFDPSKNLEISVETDRFPKILKTILVTLKATSGKDFSFLLRVNEDNSLYEATLSPFSESSRYGLSISVLDFKERMLKSLRGTLAASVASSVGRGSGAEGEPHPLFLVAWLLILLGIALGLSSLTRKLFDSKQKVEVRGTS